jgi:hypothetical protein
MRAATDPDELRAIAEAAQALAPRLDPGMARSALALVLDTIGAARNMARAGVAAEALAGAVQALAARLDPEAAQPALNAVLDAMRTTAADPNMAMVGALGPLAEVVHALAARLDLGATRSALAPVLDAMRAALDVVLAEDAAEALAGAVQTLAPRLDPEAAQPAFNVVLDAMRDARNRVRAAAADELAGAAQALAPRLDREAVRSSVLAPVLDALRVTIDPDELWALARAVQALAPRLDPEAAQPAFNAVLDPMRDRRNMEHAAVAYALAGAAQALAPRLDPEAAQPAFDAVLDLMRTATTDPSMAMVEALGPLAGAARVLAPTPEAIRPALALVLDAMRATTDLDELWAMGKAVEALAGAVQALAPQLDPEAARSALNGLLDPMRDTRNVERAAVAYALAGAVGALAPQLDPEAAQPAFNTVLDIMRTAAASPADPARAFGPLTVAAQALAGRLDPEAARSALAPVLDAMRAARSMARAPAADALAEVVQALVPRLDGSGRIHLLHVVQSGLGGARTGSEARAWAGIFQTMLPGSGEERTAMIVGVLKYPTSALRSRDPKGKPDDPTALLLGKLDEGAADAATLAGGDLASAVAWIAERYPGIDLASPPDRPAPLDDVAAALAPGGDIGPLSQERTRLP